LVLPFRIHSLVVPMVFRLFFERRLFVKTAFPAALFALLYQPMVIFWMVARLHFLCLV
jgi:hypothetical protein